MIICDILWKDIRHVIVLFLFIFSSILDMSRLLMRSYWIDWWRGSPIKFIGDFFFFLYFLSIKDQTITKKNTSWDQIIIRTIMFIWDQTIIETIIIIDQMIIKKHWLRSNDHQNNNVWDQMIIGTIFIMTK